MEIERKYLIKNIPLNLSEYPCLFIEQGYLNTQPVVRVRRQNDDYYLTYKSLGMMAREEYNLPLDKTAYEHLIAKADGIVITKKRYLIPMLDAWEAMSPDTCAAPGTDTASDTDALSGTEPGQRHTGHALINPDLTVELDIFEGVYDGLKIAEVEFKTTAEAESFIPPTWFGEDVTFSTKYHNSRLSQGNIKD